MIPVESRSFLSEFETVEKPNQKPGTSKAKKRKQLTVDIGKII